MRALEFIRDHVTFKLPYDFSYHMKTPNKLFEINFAQKCSWRKCASTKKNSLNLKLDRQNLHPDFSCSQTQSCPTSLSSMGTTFRLPFLATPPLHLYSICKCTFGREYHPLDLDTFEVWGFIIYRNSNLFLKVFNSKVSSVWCMA